MPTEHESQPPTDTELLSFILASMRSQNLKMDGKSTWYLPSNFLFGHRSQTPQEALQAAFLEYRTNLARLEKSPGNLM